MVMVHSKVSFAGSPVTDSTFTPLGSEDCVVVVNGNPIGLFKVRVMFASTSPTSALPLSKNLLTICHGFPILSASSCRSHTVHSFCSLSIVHPVPLSPNCVPLPVLDRTMRYRRPPTQDLHPRDGPCPIRATCTTRAVVRRQVGGLSLCFFSSHV